MDRSWDSALPADIYQALRALAKRHFGHQASHTLQPTALVHEAFVKIAASSPQLFDNESHFTAVAITAMRQIMVDHARAKAALKRGGPNARRVTLTDVSDSQEHRLIDLLALDTALGELEALDARQAKAVELRFFGGLTVHEIAEVQRISVATVERDLRKAKAWLRVSMTSA